MVVFFLISLSFLRVSGGLFLVTSWREKPEGLCSGQMSSLREAVI